MIHRDILFLSTQMVVTLDLSFAKNIPIEAEYIIKSAKCFLRSPDSNDEDKDKFWVALCGTHVYKRVKQRSLSESNKMDCYIAIQAIEQIIGAYVRYFIVIIMHNYRYFKRNYKIILKYKKYICNSTEDDKFCRINHYVLRKYKTARKLEINAYFSLVECFKYKKKILQKADIIESIVRKWKEQLQYYLL